MRKVLLINLFMAMVFTAFAQPANDNVSSAIPLIINNGSSNTVIPASGITTTDATDGEGLGQAICDMLVEEWDSQNDIWYTLESYGDGTVSVDFTNAVGGIVVSIFAGYPSAGNEVACGNGGWGNDFSLEATISANTLYYVRMYMPWGPDSGGESISLDATVSVMPSNDEVVSAIPLITNNGSSNTVIPATAISTEGATENEGLGQAICDDLDNEWDSQNDIWFTIQTFEDATVSVEFTDASSAIVISLYEGSPSAGNEIACKNGYQNDATLVSDVSANTLYYVRMYLPWGPAAGGEYISLDATISELTNDSYQNAYPLITSGGVQTLVSQTTIGASSVGSPMDIASCDDNDPDGNPNASPDVWYTLNTNMAHAYYSVSIETAADEGVRLELYTISGGVFTEVACNHGWISASVDGYIQPNTEYFVRVHTEWNPVDFDIIATLTVLSQDALDIQDNIQTGQDLATATASHVPAIVNSCIPDWYTSTSEDIDLWYKFTTPYDGEFNVEITNAGDASWALYMVLYENTSSGLVEINACGNGAGGGALIYTESFDSRHHSSSRSGTEYLVRVIGVDDTEPFDIEATGSAIVLPVELKSFQAIAKTSGNHISWTTLSEINSDYIEVQSSTDGVEWNTIGLVDAMGQSSVEVSYSYIDDKPFVVTYYRLNAVDMDGNTEFSYVINVVIENNEKYLTKMSIAPNPTANNMILQASSLSENIARINIRSLTGQILHIQEVSLVKGLNTIDIDMIDLPSGVYMLSLYTTKGVEIEKIVKQ